MENSVFKLFKLPSDNKAKTMLELDEGDICDNGSAFFISDDGKFLTAGHVVDSKSNEHKFCAVIGDNLIDVEILYAEYKSAEKQNSTYWQDFALGKLMNEQDEIEYLKINRTQSIIPKGEQISHYGYSSVPILHSFRNNDKLRDINDLAFDTEVFSKPPKAKKRTFYHLKGYFSGKAKYFLYNKSNNLFGFEYPEGLLKANPSGMSGGPIIDCKGLLLGIFIRGGRIKEEEEKEEDKREGIGISADYIYDKLIEQNYL
jgi:hypothetical protein